MPPWPADPSLAPPAESGFALGLASHHVVTAATLAEAVLEEAHHLSPADRAGAIAIVRELARVGMVHLPDTAVTRLRAIGGVQWAMENVLDGAEFIITPLRAMPLRTLGEPAPTPDLEARARALIGRLRRGSPLHLVFCTGGEGTTAQDEYFRQHVLQRFAPPPWGAPLVREYRLPCHPALFPPMLGGACLTDRPPRGARFAVVSSVSTEPSPQGLTLLLGESPRVVPVGPGALPTSPGQSALSQQLRQWAHWLRQQVPAAGDAMIATML